MNLPDIKNCPFCRSEATVETETIETSSSGGCHYSEEFQAYVECLDCGARSRVIEFDRPEQKEGACKKAIESWNTRGRS